MSVAFKNYTCRDWALGLRIKLSPTEKIVLVCLADYANPDGTNAYPSMAALAADVECSERTVHTTLHSLAQAGVITKSEHLSSHHTVIWHLARTADLAVSDPARTATLSGQDCNSCSSRTANVADNLLPLPTTHTKKNTHYAREDARGGGGLFRSEGKAPIPGDWQPDAATLEVGAQRGLDPAWVDEFRAYFTARPQTLDADWQARAQRWARRQTAPQGRSGKGARATVASTRKKPATLEARVMALHAALPDGCDARAEDPDHFMTIARQINLSDDYRGPLEPKFETFVQFINRGFVAYNLVEVSGRWVKDHAEPARSSAAFAQVWARDAIHLDAEGIHYVRGPNP
jgi:hypothetical protein